MGAAEVSSVLWRERELLDMLQFKLEEEQALLATGRNRWLARATNEVEVVLEELRKAELVRAVQTEHLARELGLGPGASLRALAVSVPEPWGQILMDHRKAFLAATAEIQGLAQSNRDILSSGYKSLCDTLVSFDSVPDTYTAAGTTAHGSGRARLLDGAM